jgi:hypothetical protein
MTQLFGFINAPSPKSTGYFVASYCGDGRKNFSKNSFSAQSLRSFREAVDQVFRDEKLLAHGYLYPEVLAE